MFIFIYKAGVLALAARFDSGSYRGGICGGDHGEAAFTLWLVQVQKGVDIHLQPMENPTPSRWIYLERNINPLKSPCWNRVLAGTVACRGKPCQDRFSNRTCHSEGNPYWKSLFLDKKHAMKRIHTETVR